MVQAPHRCMVIVSSSRVFPNSWGKVDTGERVGSAWYRRKVMPGREPNGPGKKR